MVKGCGVNIGAWRQCMACIKNDCTCMIGHALSLCARQGPPAETLHLMTVAGGPRQLRTNQNIALHAGCLYSGSPRHSCATPLPLPRRELWPPVATLSIQADCGGHNEGVAKASGSLISPGALAEGKIISQGRKGLSRWRTAAKASKKTGPIKKSLNPCFFGAGKPRTYGGAPLDVARALA